MGVWVKFRQAVAQPDDPHASLNAVITDGTRYQDPQDKEYTNIVAKATDTLITSQNEWVRLSIPFDYATYEANRAEARAILVTMSTNAHPGKGSAGDEFYIDDLELVYLPKVRGIRVFGNEVQNFDPAVSDYDIRVPEEPTADVVVPTAPGYTTATFVNKAARTISLVAFGDDLQRHTVYTLKYTVDPTVTNGIDSATAGGHDQVVAVYNINGQKVSAMQPGQLYIIRYADGTTVKVMGK